MNSPVFRRTRATRFAQLLDEAAGGRRKRTRTAHDAELTELVDVARRLSQIPTVEVDPDFRATLRQRLVAAAANQLPKSLSEHARDSDTRDAPIPRLLVGRRPTDPERSRAARVAIAVTALASVIAISGISTASGDAMPGQTLYEVKRSTERAQLALAGSDLNRGQLYLQFAATRLTEAAAATTEGSRDYSLDEMDAATRAGMRLLGKVAVERDSVAPLDAVDAFVEPQRRRVMALAERLTSTERARTLTSLDLLSRVQERSATLRQSLLCTDSRSVRSDDLGPVPGRCSAAVRTSRSNASPHDGKASRDHRDPTSTRSGKPSHQRPDTTDEPDHASEPDHAGKPDHAGPGNQPGPPGGTPPGLVKPHPTPPPDQRSQPLSTDQDDGGGLLQGLSDLIKRLFG